MTRVQRLRLIKKRWEKGLRKNCDFCKGTGVGYPGRKYYGCDRCISSGHLRVGEQDARFLLRLAEETLEGSR